VDCIADRILRARCPPPERPRRSLQHGHTRTLSRERALRASALHRVFALRNQKASSMSGEGGCATPSRINSAAASRRVWVRKIVLSSRYRKMGASGPPNFRANRWLAPRGVHRRHRDRGFESGFLQRRVCKPAVQNWGNLLAGLSLFSFRVWHPVSEWISRSPEIVNLRSNSQSRLEHKARHR